MHNLTASDSRWNKPSLFIGLCWSSGSSITQGWEECHPQPCVHKTIMMRLGVGGAPIFFGSEEGEIFVHITEIKLHPGEFYCERSSHQ